MNFIVGQRWISHTESQLGLGIVCELSGRLVTVSFPAAAEERSYAIDNAPLSRVIYKVGDKVNTMDEIALTISELQDRAGIIFYQGIDETGESHQFTELDLDCFVKFNSPEQRLLATMFDSSPLYQLRVATLEHSHRLQQSPVKGLLGSRTSLLPHQIYIASEVAKRFAPRVLLADEVGLGKTIEAGMILHQQLQTGLASRVLIVVPDTLIHQWLVEMLRKFNLRFAIFDQGRYEALSEEAPEANPFDSEQLVLCSLDFLTNNSNALMNSLKAEWDLLIVDEAHHLQWSATDEDAISPEYEAVELLAESSAGTLLLTATPEQMGIESHFARLRLLDPARFYDLGSFIKEEQGYAKLAELVSQLMELEQQEQALKETHFALLEPYLGQELSVIKAHRSDNNDSQIINLIIEKLLDRHGTGRILFRNTRAAIDDFPERQLHAEGLRSPVQYPKNELYPELMVSQAEDGDWLYIDPRVNWLLEKLKEIQPAKALVICAHASTAKALERFLKIKTSIRSASFNENMSIIERDSAAAYFADEEDGAQVLICSEIGSEGRNFQFAHHLVLFDLPLNPDLLEQRIGRLDRIGQRHPIQIHVPYLKNSAQEVLFKWLNQGLSLFTRSCSVANSIYQTFKQPLHELLQSPEPKALEQLVAQTHDFTEKALISMEQGRDPLLEFNSCRPQIAGQLIDQILEDSEQSSLNQYSTRLFDLFGLELEEHSEHAQILHQTDHMLLDAFPGLDDESLTFTSNRETALSREDMAYLTWEHPLLRDSMDMILSGELGNACIMTLPIKGLAPGTFLLEAFHSIKCMAPSDLQLEKFLPLTPTRTLVDLKGKDLSKIISFEQLNERCRKMKKTIAQGVIPQIKQQVEQMSVHGKKLAQSQFKAVVEQSLTQHQAAISVEIERLQALKAHNGGIRQDEIDYFNSLLDAGAHYIGKAQVQCEAIRVIITT